ncbi:tetracycline resistance protein tetb signature [Lucifera butyrica]|uniref:Tetracycline resistance protein tetb signature n=1 Tax=Lucifera butyrica TaxID=1351585 RepID=A0A498RGF7_9FIRM|nr:DHA2 family efflux MFS transporter permease subunit [Lucifera butyrica]VBB09890.1 tetracycline resistance protein tetb signature [Lucifera butyrica]
MLKKYAVLCAVCLGTVLSAYVSSSVNIALPNIMASLNFNMDSVVWVSLSYMLPYGSTLPLTGKLGDQLGVKTMYLSGMVVFTIASILCGMATSSTAMLIFRVIQGLGAGMLLPNAMTIVARTFEPHERGQALGFWSAMAAGGSALGPTVGGYFIEMFNWQSIFFSIIPVAILSILFAFLVIPSFERNSEAQVDYLGAVLLTTSIAAMLIALNQGQKEGWTSLYITLLFYLSFASFIFFLVAELRVDHPMVDLTLFKNLNFTAANVVGFITFVAMYGCLFLLPFFLKSILNYNSITAGLMLLPYTITMVLFAPIGGWISDRIGSRIPAFLGICLITLSLYSFQSITADFGPYDFFYRLVVFGIGLGFTMSPLTNCAIASLPHDKVGVGSGVFNLAKIIGGSVGAVLVETLLSNREVFHRYITVEHINAAVKSPQEIFHLLQTLWSNQGMDLADISEATHGWVTGQGFLPSQYAAFKLVLAKLVEKHVTVLSFQDVFHAMALLSFCGGLMALLIKTRPAALNRK